MNRHYTSSGCSAYFKVRAKEIMDKIGIDENRKVKGLGSRQVAALLETLK